jgi:hypothetical protein
VDCRGLKKVLRENLRDKTARDAAKESSGEPGKPGHDGRDPARLPRGRGRDPERHGRLQSGRGRSGGGAVGGAGGGQAPGPSLHGHAQHHARRNHRQVFMLRHAALLRRLL